jgi:hypothetical protein
MGMNTALKNEQILENAYAVLGIELMAAAQALDFRDFHVGKGTPGRPRRSAGVAPERDLPLHRPGAARPRR